MKKNKRIIPPVKGISWKIVSSTRGEMTSFGEVIDYGKTKPRTGSLRKRPVKRKAVKTPTDPE